MIVRLLSYATHIFLFLEPYKKMQNGCGRVGQTGEGRVDVNIKGFETKRNISFASLAWKN